MTLLVVVGMFLVAYDVAWQVAWKMGKVTDHGPHA